MAPSMTGDEPTEGAVFVMKTVTYQVCTLGIL